MTEKSKAPHGPIMLGDLIAALDPEFKHACQNVPISCITDDSRRVEPGALFVAVPGEQVDGHRFIQEAVRNGAGAVVCQEAPSPLPGCPVIVVPDCRIAMSALAHAFYGRPSESLCVVGVTGTDGKTTTTELIRAILREAGCRAGSLGTVTYNLGARSVDSDQTTPHPLRLHAMFREMTDAGLTHVAMEVSSHSLVHHRTAHVPFRAAVLTNVTEDHLDFHGSHEAYVRAKQTLFENLSPNAFAVLNAASPLCKRFRKATRATPLTFGMDSDADIWGEKRRARISGMELQVRTPLESFSMHTPLTGDHNCENMLAAAAVAFALEVPPGVAQRALERFKGVPGRLERVSPNEPGTPTVLVDYAHTPNALETVLTTLRPLTRGRLTCVFGCGGNREKQKRPAMGAISTSLADLTIITSDNSRSEATEDIIAQIVSGIKRPSLAYITEPDRRRAIEKALAYTHGPDDVVVICGKGCEQVQILGAACIPFDDRMVAREILMGQRSLMRKTA